MAKVIQFNTDRYAAQLARICSSRLATVQVIDLDLNLAIRVYEGTPDQVEENEATLVGEHNTGVDGSTPCPEAENLADRLVVSLTNAGFQAWKYDWSAPNNCPYCGGDCPYKSADSDPLLHYCDGFAGDIDGLLEPRNVDGKEL